MADRTRTRDRDKPPVRPYVERGDGTTEYLDEQADQNGHAATGNGRAALPLPERDRNTVGRISVADYEEGEREAMIPVRMVIGDKPVMLRVVYDPNELTEEVNGRMREMGEDGDNLAFATVLSEVIVEWEMWGPLTARITERDDEGRLVYDDNGRLIREKRMIVEADTIIPLDPEVMQYIKTHVLVDIWKAINKDALPDDPNSSRRSRKRSSTRR